MFGSVRFLFIIIIILQILCKYIKQHNYITWAPNIY